MYKTRGFNIKQSSVHKDGWVFSEINGPGWFMIYASERQMMNNYGSPG